MSLTRLRTRSLSAAGFVGDPKVVFACGYHRGPCDIEQLGRYRPRIVFLYFLVFGTCLALAALFFSCLAASAFTCFWTTCLCVAFGDLSPMTRRVRSMTTGVNSEGGRFLLRQYHPRNADFLMTKLRAHWRRSILSFPLGNILPAFL